MATLKTGKIAGQEKFKKAYSLAGEAASEMMGDVKQQAKDTLEVKKAKADELSARAQQMIVEKPLLSIGAAFVAGWAVSKLLKR